MPEIFFEYVGKNLLFPKMQISDNSVKNATKAL